MNSKAALQGLLAGVAAMTLAEELEQLITTRPNSYVTTHTSERLPGFQTQQDNDFTNWAMHWREGILLGAVRGIMAKNGFRAPVGSFLFMNLRLLNDQTLENATGVVLFPGHG